MIIFTFIFSIIVYCLINLLLTSLFCRLVPFPNDYYDEICEYLTFEDSKKYLGEYYVAIIVLFAFSWLLWRYIRCHSMQRKLEIIKETLKELTE